MNGFLLTLSGIFALGLTATCLASSEALERAGGAPGGIEQMNPGLRMGAEAGRHETLSNVNGGADEIYDQEHAQPRRLTAQSPGLCDTAVTGSQLELQIDEYTLQASFTCAKAGNDQNTALAPTVSSGTTTNKCFAESTCGGGEKGISEVLSGVNGVVQQDASNPKTFTVTLQKMPIREKKMYLKCTNTSQDKSCVVTVSMPTSPGADTCTLNKTIELKVTAETKQVKFVCQADKGKLDPEASTSEVYEGGCTGPKKKLDAVLKGSTLTNAGGTYTLSVPTLPEKDVTLCYKCDYAQNAQTPQPTGLVSVREPCRVTIAVAAAPTSTTTQTTSGSRISCTAPSFASVFVVFAVRLWEFGNFLGHAP